MPEREFDIFISHASEDKETLVRPLANALAAYGVAVWYDEFALAWGDSLSRTIDKGLARSRFGLVVLSPAFFAKDWPEYELRGLTAKEIGSDKVILPLWHGVTREDVLAYSPTLADKFAVLTEHLSPDELALKVIEIVRPDLFARIHRKLAYEAAIARAKIERVPIEKIKAAPLIHQKLPEFLIRRIRLIRAALLGVYTHSMKFWVDGFRADSHPSREVGLWEHMAACYLEYTSLRQLTAEQHQQAFFAIYALFHREEETATEKAAALPEGDLDVLRRILRYSWPIFDIEEEWPDEAEFDPDYRERMKQHLDIEDLAIEQ